MLCPEVWNFNPPRSLVSSEVCLSDQELLKPFKHQYFNHHVSVTIPNTMQIPHDLISTILDDSQYYKLYRFPAVELMKKDFVDLFVRKGQLTVISLSKFSEEDSLFFTPCGKLILSLSKAVYQELGIEGSFTNHSKSSFGKYIIVFDLVSGSSEIENKCEKAQKKIAFSKSLYFDVVLAWEPKISNVCPSSIAYYFSQKGCDIKMCEVQFKQRLDYNITVPLIDDEFDISDFSEWLGAYSLQCDMNNDSYISMMRPPEKHTVLGQVLHLSFTGLITINRVKALITEISNYMKTKSPSLWVSLFIQGFQDSILSTKDKQFLLSDGDQHHIVIFRENCSSLVYSFHDKKKR